MVLGSVKGLMMRMKRKEGLGGDENADDQDSKTRLVKEICSLSDHDQKIRSSNPANNINNSCHHMRSSYVRVINNSKQQHQFVDWYLVLRVDENCGVDVVRRRYHQLALQVHPDKNKHPDAAIAFKLISQAYECLSDEQKRTSFNRERSSRTCLKCRKTNQPPLETTQNPSSDCTGTKIAKGVERSKRADKEQLRREFRDALKEEANVITNTMRAYHKMSRTESPLFDPSSCKLSEYPHPRVPLRSLNPSSISHQYPAKELYSRLMRCGSMMNYREEERQLPVFGECITKPTHRSTCLRP